MIAPRELKGDYCVVHGYHWPKPLRTVSHHIHPLGDGGPDTMDNQVWVCDTGHYSIHTIYARLKQTSGQLALITGGTREERRLAMRGYEAFTRSRA